MYLSMAAQLRPYAHGGGTRINVDNYNRKFCLKFYHNERHFYTRNDCKM